MLGCLLEKQQTTPEYYPMTLNALVAACRQRSNRDPVMELTERDVHETLDRLRSDVLVWSSLGARVERWEHNLDRRWELDPQSKAVMTELMLRGPQTPGELRSRCERMCPFASLAEVEAVLRRLAGGPEPFVRELPRRPGQKEVRWTSLAGGGVDDGADPGARPEPPHPRGVTASAPQAGAAGATSSVPVGSAADAGSLGERLSRLEDAVSRLAAQLEELRRSLS